MLRKQSLTWQYGIPPPWLLPCPIPPLYPEDAEPLPPMPTPASEKSIRLMFTRCPRPTLINHGLLGEPQPFSVRKKLARKPLLSTPSTPPRALPPVAATGRMVAVDGDGDDAGVTDEDGRTFRQSIPIGCKTERHKHTADVLYKSC